MMPRAHAFGAPPAPLEPERSPEEAEVTRFVEAGELRMPGPPPTPAEEAAVAAARQAWQREEAARLADAEVAWAEKSEKRLTIARIAAQRAESALEHVQRDLEKAQAHVAAREKEFAELQALYENERERWKQSPVAAQKQKAERDLQIERRMQIGLRVARDLALFVFIVVSSVVVGYRAAPIVANMLWQEAGEHGHIGPLLKKAGVPLPQTDSAPQALVNAAIVKLRAGPEADAAVVGRLWRNEAVVPIVSSGDWVLIRFGDAPHRQQGWVPASALRPVNTPVSAAR